MKDQRQLTNQVPLKGLNIKTFSQRQCTNIFWMIIGFGLIIGLASLSIYFSRLKTLIQINFPTNSLGQVCANKYRQTHPYVHFINSTLRVCISQCPNNEEIPNNYNCIPQEWCQQNKQQIKYSVEKSNQRLGGICQSEQNIQMINSIPQISKRNQFLTLYETSLWILFLSLAFSTLYLIIFALTPQIISILTIILSIVILSASIILSIYILIHKTSQLSFLFALFSLIISSIFWLVIILKSLFRRDKLGAALDIVQYITHFPISFNWILFRSLFFAFINSAIIVGLLFQYLIFSSAKDPTLQKNDVYYQINITGVYQILTVFEGVWVISFIWQLYECLITIQIVQQYFNQQIGYGVVVRHLGTLWRASFIKIFYIFPINFLSWIKPNEGSSGSSACHCLCGAILNLQRKYQNCPYVPMIIKGSDHSKSALQTKYLYHHTYGTSQQSIHNLYEMSGRVVLTALSALIIVGIEWFIYGHIGLLSCFGCIFICFVISIFQVGFYPAAGQALQLTYLINKELQNSQYNYTIQKKVVQILNNYTIKRN